MTSSDVSSSTATRMSSDGNAWLLQEIETRLPGRG